MFGWGPFLTGSGFGGVFYGPVIDPWIAWSILVTVLAAGCGALWALGGARRAPDDEGETRSSEANKKAA
jgi:hypothetical protein